MTTPTEHGLKPRDQWDAEDWADFQDGWHEASGLGFKSPRDPHRIVDVDQGGLGPGGRRHSHHHEAAALVASGRATRERHREATGL